MKDYRNIRSKTRNIPVQVGSVEDHSMMIPFEECRTILLGHGENYTDEQIELIRTTLYALACLDYKYFYKDQQSCTSQAA